MKQVGEIRNMLREDITGDPNPSSKLVKIDIDQYELLIRLSLTNEFIEVVSINIKKDFRSVLGKIRSTDYHDVSDLYEENDPE